jgi:hypothetical protein
MYEIFDIPYPTQKRRGEEEMLNYNKVDPYVFNYSVPTTEVT